MQNLQSQCPKRSWTADYQIAVLGGIAAGSPRIYRRGGHKTTYAATDAATDAPSPPTNPHDAATNGVTDGLARDAMAALWACARDAMAALWARARAAVPEPAARDAWVRQRRKEMLRHLMTEDESTRWKRK